MKVAAASAALLFWLKGSVCASLLALASPGPGPAHSSPIEHAEHAAGAAHGHGHGAGGAHQGNDEGGSSACEHHCRLVAHAGPDAPASFPPGGVTLAGVAAASFAVRSPSLRRGGARFLRAPPGAADLVLRHRTLLI